LVVGIGTLVNMFFNRKRKGLDDILKP
jgi:hypothetical protein